jgi:hypothetical protein
MQRLAVGMTITADTGAGSTTIMRMTRSCVRFTTTGRFDQAAGEFALAHTRAILEEIGEGFIGFYDWSQVTGYSSGGRTDATQHLLELRKRFKSAVFLTSSTMVSMGVNVANMALGGFLYGTTNRIDFEARLAEACRADVPT